MTKPKRVESGVYELEIESVKYRIVKTVDWVFRNGYSNWDGKKAIKCWSISRIENTKTEHIHKDSVTLKDAVKACLSWEKHMQSFKKSGE